MSTKSLSGINTDQTVEVPLGTFSLPYSSRLVRTRADLYDTLKVAAETTLREKRLITPPTSGEEHQIYLQTGAGAKKLQNVEALRDYFANNDEGWYAWGHTITVLRFGESDLRKSYNIGDKVTAEVLEIDITPYMNQIAESSFTKENWKDIIGKATQFKDMVRIPYARGHVVKEMHPTLGIFTEVDKTTEHKAPFALHGWLRENLNVDKDPISDNYDLAVWRWSFWRLGEGDGCLGVGADYSPSNPSSNVGFRPVVRGSRTQRKIEVTPANADVEQIRQEIERDVRAEMAADVRNLTVPQLLDKYKL